jgi:hypothetical protein
MKKKTNQEFLKQIEGRDLVATEEYISAKSKIWFKCLLDGYEWTGTPDNIINKNRGCPKCAGRIGNEIVAWYDNYLEVDVSTTNNPKSVMLIDTNDYLLLKQKYGGRITVARGRKSKYATIKVDNKNKFIHRVLTGSSDIMVVDHLNHNGLDNRRSNLRVCTSIENSRNMKLQKSNTSGKAGVSAFGKGYRAYININSRQKHLGLFKTFDEAVKARISAEERYFGEFAYKGT